VATALSYQSKSSSCRPRPMAALSESSSNPERR
jgi:hypothetical protein